MYSVPMSSKSSSRLRERVYKPSISDADLQKWESRNWLMIERKLAEADAAIARGEVRELTLETFLREARTKKKKRA